MKICTIDFETYYDRQFSLSKVTTEEYIRHEQFEVIGVAVKVGTEDSVWFSGTRKATREFLDSFNLQDNIVIAHNAMFDMAILNWHFGIKPKGIIDTLSMARALHGTEVGGSLKVLAEYYELGQKGTEVLDALGKRRIDFAPDDLERYGAYCRNDVDLTYGLFTRMAEKFPKLELKLIDLTIRMFSEPHLELAPEVLTQHLEEVVAKKQKLLSRLEQTKSDLMSNDKFAELLGRFNVTAPVKISPTTGKETYAFAKTDEAFKALLEHENDYVQALVAARLGVKSTIEETRTQRFLDISKRGKLPIPLRYYAAHTGRWGGDDKVNMQNLPRTSPLKKAIMAPAGYVFIDSDSSQIEARTLAWLAGQDDLVDAFDKGEDVYKIMASAIYNKPVGEITKDERFVGKTTILGAGYGMGAKKFKIQLKNFGVDIPQDEAEYIIRVYRDTYPMIPKLWRSAGESLLTIMRHESNMLGRDGLLLVDGPNGIRLPNGLYIKYPNLRTHVLDSAKEEIVYDTKRGKATIPNRIYGGKVVENVCQALARIVIGEQLVEISKRYKVVMTVHDAIGCIVPEAEEAEGKTFIETCMRSRPKWAPELPLDCEAGSGRAYGDC